MRRTEQRNTAAAFIMALVGALERDDRATSGTDSPYRGVGRWVLLYRRIHQQPCVYKVFDGSRHVSDRRLTQEEVSDLVLRDCT
jgi:hypothetical protein